MISANHLSWDEVPDSEVRFEGGPNRRSASGSHRTNLPHGVQPETDYREIRVLYTIAAKLDDPDAEDEEDEQTDEPGTGPTRRDDPK